MITSPVEGREHAAVHRVLAIPLRDPRSTLVLTGQTNTGMFARRRCLLLRLAHHVTRYAPQPAAVAPPRAA
jgi:hypothetical protein